MVMASTPWVPLVLLSVPESPIAQAPPSRVMVPELESSVPADCVMPAPLTLILPPPVLMLPARLTAPVPPSSVIEPVPAVVSSVPPFCVMPVAVRLMPPLPVAVMPKLSVMLPCVLSMVTEEPLNCAGDRELRRCVRKRVIDLQGAADRHRAQGIDDIAGGRKIHVAGGAGRDAIGLDRGIFRDAGHVGRYAQDQPAAVHDAAQRDAAGVLQGDGGAAGVRAIERATAKIMVAPLASGAMVPEPEFSVPDDCIMPVPVTLMLPPAVVRSPARLTAPVPPLSMISPRRKRACRRIA